MLHLKLIWILRRIILWISIYALTTVWLILLIVDLRLFILRILVLLSLLLNLVGLFLDVVFYHSLPSRTIILRTVRSERFLGLIALIVLATCRPVLLFLFLHLRPVLIFNFGWCKSLSFILVDFHSLLFQLSLVLRPLSRD